MPNVAFKHPSLSGIYPEYSIINDVLAGETTIKQRGILYLPVPNGDFDSKTARNRYAAYKQRAVFYNVARNTLKGLVGTVFTSEPTTNMEDEFSALLDNVTGSGVSMKQLAKQLLRYTLAFSRAGIFVDYPTTESGASQADIASGKMRPTMYAYSPLDIYNWRLVENGAQDQLSLVVLFETYGFGDDGFELKTAAQFRVLKLENGVYKQEVWKEQYPTEYKGKLKSNQVFNSVLEITPTDNNGNTFDHIPFYFIGSENNDANPDNPLFYDLCSLNLAHYRNSADYEESCFVHGQPTPVVTGLTENWWTDVLNKEIKVGSYGGVPLPKDADFTLVSAEPNKMIYEAMTQKENQMATLGARMIEKRTVQRTATETGIDRQRETSILQDCSENVTSAINNALKDVVLFGSYSNQEPTYVLNTDYDINDLDAATLSSIVGLWQKGAITFEEMRAQIRRAKIATEDDTTAAATIAREQAEAMALSQSVLEPGGPSLPNKSV